MVELAEKNDSYKKLFESIGDNLFIVYLMQGSSIIMIIQFIYFVAQKYGEELFLALLSSLIFYLIIIYFPKKKANLNTLNFLLETYKSTKLKVVELILREVKKKYPNHNELTQQIFNYEYLQSLISEQDVINIRNLSEPEIKDLSKNIFYHLSQLNTLLLLEATKDYIQVDQTANQRVCLLIQLIEQFDHAMNAIDLDQEYDKCLRNFIYDFVVGWGNWEKLEDDFSDVLKKAYFNSLFKYKIINLITRTKGCS